MIKEQVHFKEIDDSYIEESESSQSWDFVRSDWADNTNFNPELEGYVATGSFDHHLFQNVIDSIKAQVKANIKRGITPSEDGRQLADALDKVHRELSEGKIHGSRYHSIYDLIAVRVSEIAPEAYEWFHVARSKQSQKAGDLVMWIRDSLNVLDSLIQKLQSVLLDKADDNVKTIFPMYSHGQLQQPSSLGHYLLAYVMMFGRDRDRIQDARKRLSESPYTSGEMVGSLFPVGRELIARALSFDDVAANSLDAICAKDSTIEMLSIMSNSAVNISRLVGDLLQFQSTPYSYIKFDGGLVEQDFVMPYKKDPTALEVIRARTAKIIGGLNSALCMMRSLPLQDLSDYHELVDIATQAFRDTKDGIHTLTMMLSGTVVNRKAMKDAASIDYSTAKDLVDWVVAESGCTLSSAMSKVRGIVEYAISKDTKLSLLELDELKKFVPEANQDIYSVLIPARAMIGRRSGGGSNPVQVRKAIRHARRKYL